MTLSPELTGLLDEGRAILAGREAKAEAEADDRTNRIRNTWIDARAKATELLGPLGKHLCVSPFSPDPKWDPFDSDDCDALTFFVTPFADDGGKVCVSVKAKWTYTENEVDGWPVRSHHVAWVEDDGYRGSGFPNYGPFGICVEVSWNPTIDHKEPWASQLLACLEQAENFAHALALCEKGIPAYQEAKAKLETMKKNWTPTKPAADPAPTPGDILAQAVRLIVSDMLDNRDAE